ncbi:MAG: glycosyltransferase [Planctomycetota bacterium]
MDASSRMVDDPVRVAHIVATLGVGGIERWLLQVASAIDRRRVQLDVIVHDPKTGALEHPIRQTGSRVLRCPPPSRPIAWATALRHHLEAGGYDVVHAHPYRFCGPILWVSRRSGVPVRIAHSRNALPAPPWIRPHARLFEHAARRVILREMTLGLAVSSTAAAALFSGKVKELDAPTLDEVFAEVAASEHAKDGLQEGVSLIDVLSQTSLCSSKSEARKHLSSGAIAINGEKLETQDASAETLREEHLLHSSVILLRRGKKAWHVTRWA